MVFEDCSVVERREYNRELYEEIFNRANKPKKILDIGCGLNPLYFPFRDVYYIATDIDKNVLKKVKKYFRKNKINGEVFYLDIKDLNEIKKLNKVDVVFIFKVLDLLKNNKKAVVELLNSLDAKFVVVSFATKTTYGKRMNYPKRRWVENILKKLNYEYKILRFYNELFYIVEK